MANKKQLTIDEWFYHWLRDEEKYLLAAKLFIRILEICDKIVLRQGTRLAQKFHFLDVESAKFEPQHRNVIRIVKNQFISNSLKIHWVDEITDFGEEIESKLPRKDVYLVQICCQTTDKVLITTDRTLYENLLDLNEVLHITPIMVDTFIENYLSSTEDDEDF